MEEKVQTTFLFFILFSESAQWSISYRQYNFWPLITHFLYLWMEFKK